MQSYAPTSSLLGSGAVPSANAGDANSKYSMFNLKNYRKYFNVDTQVGHQWFPRILYFLLGLLV